MFARRPTYQLSPDPAPASATPPPATPPAPAAGDPPADPPARSTDPAVLSARLDKAIADEKAARARAQAAEAEAQRLAAAEADRQKKLLEEQGKYNELYAAAEKERKELAEKLATYEAQVRARADAALALIPEDLRADAPPDPVKAEAYAQKILKLTTPAPGAPTPPRPATAPAAPAPAPTATPGAPPKPTPAEMQESSYTRDPKRKAELEAKINAWQKHQRGQ